MGIARFTFPQSRSDEYLQNNQLLAKGLKGFSGSKSNIIEWPRIRWLFSVPSIHSILVLTVSFDGQSFFLHNSFFLGGEVVIIN